MSVQCCREFKPSYHADEIALCVLPLGHAGRHRMGYDCPGNEWSDGDKGDRPYRERAPYCGSASGKGDGLCAHGHIVGACVVERDRVRAERAGVPA